MKFILKFIILTVVLSLFVLFYNNGKYITIQSTENAYIPIAIFLGVLVILNVFIKPIIKLFTLPLNCLTFGLFSFVVNFIVVYLADKLVDSFAFTDWIYTFIFSIVFAGASSVIDYFLKDNE